MRSSVFDVNLLMRERSLNSEASLLKALLDGRAVPASSMSAPTRKSVLSLFEVGAIVEERKGAGRVITCAKMDIVVAFAQSRFPAGLDGLDVGGTQAMGNRTGALQQLRDSKKIAGLGYEIVILRVFRDSALRINGNTAGAEEKTRHLKCVSVVIGLGDVVTLSGKIATTEGPELFLKYPWQTVDVDAVILTNGRVSNKVLDWIKACVAGIESVQHFGDYDPVGLDDYLRLKEKCGDKASLFIPEEIEGMFAQFSNHEILSASGALMPRISASTDPAVVKVRSLIRRHNGGLENEALLLPGFRTGL